MAMPMQPRARPRPGAPVGGGPPPQPGPPPVENVQAGAMDQYRNALLRRMQGGGQGLMPPPEMGPGSQPMQPPQGDMQPPQGGMQVPMPGGGPSIPPPGMAQGGVPDMMGGPPGQETEGGPDIKDIIQQLMGTRFSRRVLGGGSGQ